MMGKNKEEKERWVEFPHFLLNKMAKIRENKIIIAVCVQVCVRHSQACVQCRYEESTPFYVVVSKGPFDKQPACGSQTSQVSILDEKLLHKHILQSNLRCQEFWMCHSVICVLQALQVNFVPINTCNLLSYTVQTFKHSEPTYLSTFDQKTVGTCLEQSGV